ncbi:MAG: BlaI/MecI/CopY family transcriptional regulator [Oscillospiraceae bacterium]|nr:BlaI/MecI/CopY family transcriptional regulator [Oscillospiraceae bacterium]
MSDNRIKPLPDSELEVMQVLWDLTPPVPRTQVEERMAQIHPVAQTTILTLLTRLAQKDFIQIDKHGRSSVYTPLISRADYQAHQSRRFLDRVFGGSIPAFASALSASGISKEELEELKRLLEEDQL